MESAVYNTCWEFCYEVVPVSLAGSEEPLILILNLPLVFATSLEGLLSAKGFHCTKFLPISSSDEVRKGFGAHEPLSSQK